MMNTVNTVVANDSVKAIKCAMRSLESQMAQAILAQDAGLARHCRAELGRLDRALMALPVTLTITSVVR